MKNKSALILFCICVCFNTSAQTWVSLQGGMNFHGRVLFSDSISNRLYVGGNFWEVDGHESRGLAAWDGSAWDTTYGMGPYCASIILAITRYNNDLYAAGGVTYTKELKIIDGFTRWNGSSWDSLNIAFHFSGCVTGLPGFLYEYNNLLYCFGIFDSVGGYYSRKIVAWDGVNWIPINPILPIGSGSSGPATIFQNKLYFVANAYDTINNIGHCMLTWDGTNWGTAGANSGGLIHAMAVYNNELYLGGNNFGGFPCDYLVKYDGVNFSCVGNGFVGNVWNLRVIDNKLFAVGYIDSADGNPVNCNIAVWDGNTWSAFSNDTFNNAVGDIAVFNNELYVTGGFNMINSDTINYIAKYDGWFVGEELPSKKQDGVKVYPNPVSNTLTIEISSVQQSSIGGSKSGEKKEVSIYNVLGEKRLTLTLSKGEGTASVDVSGLAAGIYFVEVRTEKGAVRKKVVKM